MVGEKVTYNIKLDVLEIGVGIKRLQIHQSCLENVLVVFLHEGEQGKIHIILINSPHRWFMTRIHSPQWGQPLVSVLAEPWRPGTHPPLPLSCISQWWWQWHRTFHCESLYHCSGQQWVCCLILSGPWSSPQSHQWHSSGWSNDHQASSTWCGTE